MNVVDSYMCLFQFTLIQLAFEGVIRCLKTLYAFLNLKESFVIL